MKLKRSNMNSTKTTGYKETTIEATVKVTLIADEEISKEVAESRIKNVLFKEFDDSTVMSVKVFQREV